MAWAWVNLAVLDAWLAAEPREPVRRAVLDALAQLLEHGDVDLGERVPHPSPLVRTISVAHAQVFFLRDPDHEALHLIRIGSR